MSALLERVLGGRHLEEAEASDLIVRLCDESAPPALSGALLAGLRAKGETPEEIRGCASAMRALALRPRIPGGAPLLDIVGTGGDGSGSLNLSTGSALLAAACGLQVAKHGNRSVSSRCGSADVVEALGMRMDLDEASAGACLARTGFTFLFAPRFHPAMRAISPVRRALGVRTIFNLLGPVTNPAAPAHLVVGAYSEAAAELLAHTLAGMEVERAYVVHGAGGWDEATPIGPFTLHDARPGRVVTEVRDPAAYGVPSCAPADLAGAGPRENAESLRHALGGEPGAHRDALVLGAALALQVTGRVGPPRDAAEAAAAALDDGRAARLLEALVETSHP